MKPLPSAKLYVDGVLIGLATNVTIGPQAEAPAEKLVQAGDTIDFKTIWLTRAQRASVSEYVYGYPEVELEYGAKGVVFVRGDIDAWTQPYRRGVPWPFTPLRQRKRR